MNRIVIPLYYVPCFPVRIVSVKLSPPPVINPPPVKVTRPSRKLAIVAPKVKPVVVTPPRFPPSKLTIDMAIDAPLAPIRVGASIAAVIPPLWDFHMSVEEFQTMSTAMLAAEAVLN
jgi:hypothetical protein